MDKLKFVKLVVFILTAMLFFGTITAGMLIYQKASPKAKSSEINLNLPIGSNIDQFSVSDGQLYLLIKRKQQTDQIIVVDANSLKTTATIKTY